MFIWRENFSVNTFCSSNREIYSQTDAALYKLSMLKKITYCSSKPQSFKSKSLETFLNIKHLAGNIMYSMMWDKFGP